MVDILMMRINEIDIFTMGIYMTDIFGYIYFGNLRAGDLSGVHSMDIYLTQISVFF